MIKRETSINCTSIVVPNDKIVYDTSRKEKRSIKVFGITIWQKEYEFTCPEFKEFSQTGKQLGFSR